MLWKQTYINGEYVWQVSLDRNKPDTLFGHALTPDEDLPDGVILGTTEVHL